MMKTRQNEQARIVFSTADSKTGENYETLELNPEADYGWIKGLALNPKKHCL